MSDPKNTASSGGAKRLQAHRKRLLEAELVRADILLPKDVRDAIVAIAEVEGARYLETASALTQMGLASYQAQTQVLTEEPPMASSFQLNAVGATSCRLGGDIFADSKRSFSNSHGTRSISKTVAASTSPSPLSQFLKARKGDPS